MSATFGTWIFTRLFGEEVGGDDAGNIYYRERKPRPGRRQRRWVIYAGSPDGSAVPPEWQGWLTHMLAGTPTDKPPVERPWLRPHEANATGTAQAWRPPGALIAGGRRGPATGDYEPWTPE